MTTSGPTPEESAELNALIALAMREHRAGRLAEAAAAYRKIIACRPDYAEAHNSLGILLAQQAKLGQALVHFEQAIALRPDDAEAYNNLGNVLKQQGKFDQAVIRFEQALVLRPDYTKALFNLGNVLLSQNRLDEAAIRYEQALALRPDFAEALNNLGALLKRQGKFDQAVIRFEQALALRPDHTEGHNNLGIVLGNLGRLDEALTCFEQAAALKADCADAYNNQGNVLREQGRLDEAVARYEQALALRPDYAEAQLGLATCRLIEGDFERGWPAFEGRLQISGCLPQPSLPRWRGEPLVGRSLLLLPEQGLGDTLHFLRYARLLKERGARVVLACQPALGRLLATHLDFDELFILGSAGALPRCDYYLPLLSAPGVFGTIASTIPCKVPYLSADTRLTDKWRTELAAMDGFKIGIAWQGARDFISDRWRSVPLAQFAPLANLSGVRLISLQKGFGSEQVAAVDFPVLDLSGRLDEEAGAFMDTAALIRSLDLVVTVDTAVAHLAGALGTPVWVALQLSPYWVWLRDRDDSPWYPTMRLFRQTAFGQWSDVFLRIANAAQARRARQ